MPAAPPSRDPRSRFDPLSQTHRPRPARSQSAPSRQAAPVIAQRAPSQPACIRVGPACELLQPRPAPAVRIRDQWIAARKSAILPDVTYRNPNAFITLTVDPDSVPYQIPTHFASLHSPYFEDMVNGPAPKRKVHMGEASEYAALLLLEWLYYRTTTVRTLTDDFIPEDRANFGDQAHIALAFATFYDRSALLQLWVVADRLSIPALQNSALSQLNSVINKFGIDFVHSIPFVYDNTSKGSELRRYLVAVVSINAAAGIFEHERIHKQYPRDFLLEMGHYLLESRDLARPDPRNHGDLAQQFLVPVGARGLIRMN